MYMVFFKLNILNFELLLKKFEYMLQMVCQRDITDINIIRYITATYQLLILFYFDVNECIKETRQQNGHKITYCSIIFRTFWRGVMSKCEHKV